MKGAVGIKADVEEGLFNISCKAILVAGKSEEDSSKAIRNGWSRQETVIQPRVCVRLPPATAIHGVVIDSLNSY